MNGSIMNRRIMLPRLSPQEVARNILFIAGQRGKNTKPALLHPNQTFCFIPLQAFTIIDLTKASALAGPNWRSC